ncbi:hypothetical protein L226DRAFT_540619 [Lentinus tigrinus ALCF2SS1-7]|uniref:Uncharacterized protein n=1 Tax=Lentinus tigrinus ALCF2SS1-6 TaxID=1328759 RepID=A0A5C2RXM9_9APHY|nr:hypothetical protein L227DRAFT_579496 [Lentinus tigrinus ALCF2SS1-6]RPD68516.1 hypothetical protein L226DRAFT_540619 [Lentinus tigrinus ALCF2SS1-7]
MGTVAPSNRVVHRPQATSEKQKRTAIVSELKQRYILQGPAKTIGQQTSAGQVRGASGDGGRTASRPNVLRTLAAPRSRCARGSPPAGTPLSRPLRPGRKQAFALAAAADLVIRPRVSLLLSLLAA